MGVKTSVDQLVSTFFAQYPLRAFAKGQVLSGPGQEKKEVFYIVRGHVRQGVVTASGQDVTLTLFKPGAFFPMMWMTGVKEMPYSFEAVDATQVRVAPYEHVVVFLTREPTVTLDLLRRVYIGLDGILLQNVHQMAGTARSQVVRALSVLAKRFGVAHSQGVQIQLPLTHADLAAMTGLTRETVSRQISELKKHDLVQMHKSFLVVASSLCDTDHSDV
jgi:CRP-like cAMP-binding protein